MSERTYTQAEVSQRVIQTVNEFRRGIRPGRTAEAYRRQGNQWAARARRSSAALAEMYMDMATVAFEAEAQAELEKLSPLASSS